MKTTLRTLPGNQGGILPTTVLLIALMSMLTAVTLYRVSSRYSATYQSVGWNEALASAEAGADLALVALNNAVTSPSTAWAGWTPNDATTFPKTYVPSIPNHIGEGNVKVYAKVVVDKPVGGGWPRVRSTGVSELPSRSKNGLEAAIMDINGVKNHRTVLRKPRYLNDITNGVLKLPQITRTIELMASPATSFPYVMPFLMRRAIWMNGNAWIDSFDSSNPLYSTNSQYDWAKHRNNGDIASNVDGRLSNLNGSFVYGNASSNGGVISNTQNVQGTVTNNFQTTIAEIPAPSWGTIQASPTTLKNAGTRTLVGGTVGSPKNYKVDQLTLNNFDVLTFDTHAAGEESYLNIWVTGKVVLAGQSSIVQKPGVHVTFYCDDDASFTGNGYANLNNTADTLQIFGISGSGGNGAHTMKIAGIGNFVGLVNAPTYYIDIVGNGSFVGCVIGYNAKLSGNGGFHYDEDLKLLPAPGATNYQFVSWVEDIR
jgi:hypothetical protein